jgi:hypothetical protein
MSVLYLSASTLTKSRSMDASASCCDAQHGIQSRGYPTRHLTEPRYPVRHGITQHGCKMQRSVGARARLAASSHRRPA